MDAFSALLLAPIVLAPVDAFPSLLVAPLVLATVDASLHNFRLPSIGYSGCVPFTASGSLVLATLDVLPSLLVALLVLATVDAFPSLLYAP
jgi:hypothetical protein